MLLRKKPLLLHYYISDGCNAKCSFCNIWKNSVIYASLDDISKNLKDAKALGCKFVDFTGGEPLMHKKVCEALVLAKENGFLTSITTNGLLLKKKAESLKGLVDYFHVSLDGNREIHNKMRGVDCYDSAINGIDECLKHGIKPDVLFTLTNENKDCINEVYDFCKKRKIILILDPVFSYFGNNEHKELDNILKTWKSKRGVYVNGGFLVLRDNGGNDFEDPVCKAVTSTVVIDAKNNLVLPCMHKAEHKINLLENGLINEFKSKKRLEIEKQQGKYSFCNACTINCYMDPSFCYNLDRYFLSSMQSKAGYVIDKFLWR